MNQISDMRWSVREATEQDVPWLVAGCCNLARETEGVELDPMTVERGVTGALRNGYATYLLAVQASDPSRCVGQLMITREWSDWRNGWFWWIQSVWVAPEARRCGVYSTLHAAVERRARDRGDVCGIRLYVEPENKPAIATYRTLGMKLAAYHMMECDFSGIRGPHGTEAHLD